MLGHAPPNGAAAALTEVDRDIISSLAEDEQRAAARDADIEAAELFNLVKADLAKDSSLNKPAAPSTRKRS